MRRAALLLVAVPLATACGAAPTLRTSAAGVVPPPGWNAVADPPGISSLAPDFSGLAVTAAAERPALVRSGDVIRSATFVFATPAGAAKAQHRAAGDDYLRSLEDAFPGDLTGREPGGYRFTVPRPAEPGADTVELFFVRGGRRLTLVELVSAAGFAPALRTQALAAVSR